MIKVNQLEEKNLIKYKTRNYKQNNMMNMNNPNTLIKYISKNNLYNKENYKNNFISRNDKNKLFNENKFFRKKENTTTYNMSKSKKKNMDNHLLQIQIKTFQMDEINTFGLAAYWLSLKGEGKNKMQNELKLNYQFFDTIRNINEVIRSDSDFIDKVKQEIFSNNIYVYTLNGDIIELPKNSSVIDFAYKLHPNIGNHLYKAYVNGRQVKLSHSLKNKDRIMVITKETSHPNKEWLKYISTIKAKELVMDYLENGDVNQK